MKKALMFLLFGASFLLAKPIVTTSILPTKYFVEQIAGNTVDVNVMVGKGADPHTYEPKPTQMKNLEKSTLYFAVGIDFEHTWLDRFKKSYPNLIIVNTADGIEKIQMASHEHEEHDHDAKHEDHDHEADHKHDVHHDHEDHDHDTDHKHDDHEAHEEHHHHHHDGLDPHIWLDPILVKTQAKTIADALIKAFPKNKDLYSKNLDKFIANLDSLDKFIENELKNVKNRSFIVYHPSWGYFAKRYNLVQIPIEIEGKEPKIADLTELIKEAKEENIKVIFVAPQFSKKSANLIAKETNASVVEIDQLPQNWEESMKQTAIVFAKSL